MRMFRNTLINPTLVRMEAIWVMLHLRRMLLSNMVTGKLRNTVLELGVLGMRVVMLVLRRLHITLLLLRSRENLLVDRGEIFEIDVFFSCYKLHSDGVFLKGYGGRMNTRLEEGEEDNVLVRIVFFCFSNYISIMRNILSCQFTLLQSYKSLYGR